MTAKPQIHEEQTLKETLYRVIFESDTHAGRLFDRILIFIILVSILVVVLDSVQSISAKFHSILFALEWFFTFIFTIEYLSRLYCAPDRRKYALSFFGIIDLIAFLPTYLALFFPELHSLIDVRVLRLLRIFRIFKLTSFLVEYNHLANALAASRRKIMVFLSVVLMIVMVMGTLMYVVEGPQNGFTNIPISIYWAITTMTTVGFGDFSVLEENYANVEKYIQGICKGEFRSVIVNGPPGVGKSYSVEKYLQQYAQADSYKVAAGHMTPLSLYGNLYKYRNVGDVLVLDDIDSVFEKLEGINLLKAAMDTKPVRQINWESSSSVVVNLGLPSHFEFKGSIVLISNIGFVRKKGKMQEHLEALKDRSYSLHISDNTKEELYQQVCFMVIKKNLLREFDIDAAQQSKILDYIGANLDKINKISLRLAMKLASLMKANSAEWESMADSGLLSGSLE